MTATADDDDYEPLLAVGQRPQIRRQIIQKLPFDLFENNTADYSYDAENETAIESSTVTSAAETIWKVLMTNASTLSHPEDSLRADPVLTFVSSSGTNAINNPLAMDEPLRSFVLAMYIMIIIVAVFGNAMVIIVHYTLKHGQKDVSTFLVSLALADLLLTVFCIPGTMLQITDFAWKASPFLCKPTTFLQTYCVLCSVYTLVIVGIDRLHLILYPLHRRLASGRTAVRYIGGAWLLLIPLASMQWFVTETIPYYVDGRRFISCQENPAGWTHTHALVIFGTTYALPLSLISVIYGTIGWKLWHKIPPGCSLSHDSIRLIKSKQKVVKTLLIIVVLFAILWLPLHVLNLLVIFVPESSMFRPETPATVSELASVVISNVTESSEINTTTSITSLPSLLFEELKNSTLTNSTNEAQPQVEENYDYLIPHIRRYRSLLAPVHILAMMSSCVNPIVYSFSHVPFRKQCIFLFETAAINAWQLIRCRGVTNEHALRRRKQTFASQRRKYDGYTASASPNINSRNAAARRNNRNNADERNTTVFQFDNNTTEAAADDERGDAIELENRRPAIKMSSNASNNVAHRYQNGTNHTLSNGKEEKSVSADLDKSSSFPVHTTLDETQLSHARDNLTNAYVKIVASAEERKSPSPHDSKNSLQSDPPPHNSERSLDSAEAADTAVLGAGILEMAASSLRFALGTSQAAFPSANHKTSSSELSSATAETIPLKPDAQATAATENKHLPVQHKTSLLKPNEGRSRSGSKNGESSGEKNRRRRIQFVIQDDGDLDVI